jgi:hypothetical protein
MIKRLFVSLPILLLGVLPVSASVTISVDAGLLTSHTGADLTDGDLILLIASTGTGTFGPATPGGFVSGDDVIVGSLTLGDTGAFAMADQNTRTTGQTFNELIFDYGIGSVSDASPTASTFAAGDKLAIRWYDDFTLAQFEAGQTPTQGDYGTYTTVGTSAPDGGLGWVAPPDGVADTGAQGLNFFTLSDAGTQPNILGEAGTPVLGAAVVPEPSNLILMGAGLLICVVSVMRKRQNLNRAK